MGTKEKSSKAKKVKVNKLKIEKKKLKELSDKQAKRIRGGVRKGNWVLDTSYEKPV